MAKWFPDLSRSSSPRYMAIADLIEMDLRGGVLTAGDRLPPQRELARALDIDFTTVARGYVEARKRGLVDTQVGRGTFVTGRSSGQDRSFPADAEADARRAAVADFSMNLPPEPEDSALLARMREGLGVVSANLVPLLRYQEFGGAEMDRDAAATWLGRRGIKPSPQHVFVTPGTHPALHSILALLARPGETILAERITYPGIRSLTAQLGIHLTGLAMDEHGIVPDALAEACRSGRPRALYLNPTLQNPTTLTVPQQRREAIVAIAQSAGVPIIEDDAYGFIPPDAPPPIAAVAPELTWHIGGLSKCIGAGLRLAFVVAPDARAAWTFKSAMRASNVMASPLGMALATRWIEDETADALLGFVRTEAAARQQLAARLLPSGCYRADPLSFNLWLSPANGWNRSSFATHSRNAGLGVVASDAFTVEGTPPDAVRVCLGGPVTRASLADALGFMAHALAGPPEMTGAFF